MNTRNNARGVASKVKIRDAFLRLRAAKEFDNISVMELCEAARVHRTTFYAHYADVYDLRDKIEEEYAREFAEALTRECGGDIDYLSAQAHICVARFLRDNSAYFRLHAAPGYCKPLDMCLAQLMPRAQGRSKYIAEFITRGLTGIWAMWIMSDFSTSAEEIAGVTREMLSRALSGR